MSKLTDILIKKSGIFLLLIFLFQAGSAQQQVLLFTEGFDNGPTSFVFDSGGISLNTGNNDWIINNQYTGTPVYPNTPNEDSVLSGTINDAPYSNYLHIHDVTTTTVTNANWNPASASDRFCSIGSPFCTLGLTDVVFTFFWIGEGDSTAYGRVYYQANGGPWIQCGQAKYNDANKWQYESIQNPAFNNVENLVFGFRWVNAGSDTTKDVSWGIDDVLAVGTYDNVNNPVTLTITSISPDTVCQKDDILVGYSLSAPLCDGTYDIKMSDSVGNFTNSTDMGVFDVYAPETSGFIYIQAPNNVEGNCFRITITRLAPAPQITSDTSICFAIQHCPVSIITDGAPVMNDADTTCVKSAIDISFNSFGNFNQNNIYYAQLSDSNGNFAHADTIGHLVSNLSYPGIPGTVSGLIPVVPPGCGYYIRIVSSNPAAIGTTIGPFCLTDCDVTTNNTQDIHVCINYPNATDTVALTIKDSSWNQGAQYDTCNNWTIELLDMMTFSVVNIGGLGVYHDSVSGVFKLIIGPLANLPVAPGSYYMRIISNCSNEPWNETGTVIRITIGAPSSTPPTILSTQADSVYCNNAGLLELYVVPYNPNSIYFWNSNLFNNGLPIQEPGQIFLGNLQGAPVGNYVFYVREENFGCYGPSSAPYNYVITTLPKIHITGPKKVCLGDTAILESTYVPATYYTWSAPPGVQVIQHLLGNNETYLVFDSIGTFQISCHSLNACGSDDTTYSITVTQLFSVNAKPDKTVCAGDSVSLTGVVAPYPKTFISLDSSITGNQGGMFNIYAHSDIIIDSFAVSFRSRTPNTNTHIYSKAGSYRSFEQTSNVWALLASNTIAMPGPLLSKTVIPVELNKTVSAGDTIAFYITTTNANPVVDLAYGNGIGIQQNVLFKTDGVIDFEQGCENAYPFGAHSGPKVLDVTIYYRTAGGLHYLWNNGDTTATITFVPTQSGQYTIRVSDTTGCNNSSNVNVTVDTLPQVYAGPDTTVCPYGSYIMPATASPTATVAWLPATGLSNAGQLQPVFNYNQPINFILTATNPGGCSKSDSVLINVYPLSVNAGPDTTICEGETYIMVATASADSVEWMPGTGLSATNILNPVFNYNQTTPYVLQATDSIGCKVSDTVVITVEYCNTYIKAPEAFTPNGDGVNDYFTVFGAYIADYQIRIYNRWGEEVYSSDDVNELNNLSRGWDGIYKGKLQDVGTFVYYITAKDLNGHNIFKKGNITLIR